MGKVKGVKNIRFTEAQMKEILEMSLSGKYMVEDIARKFGINPDSFQNYCTRHKIKSNFQYRKYTRNNDYFSVIGYNQCYWSGMLVCDGSLVKNGKQKRIDWSVSAVDSDHLQLFLNQTESTNGIFFYKYPCALSKDKEKLLDFARITFDGVQSWVIALEKNFGFTANKTRRFPPPNLPTLKHKLAFWKGMIDGDGCLSVTTEDKLNIRITGCNKELLLWMKGVFDSLKIPSLIKSSQAMVRELDQGTYYSYSLAGFNAMIFFELMRRVETPTLKRKWENPKLLEILLEHKLHPNWPPESFFESILSDDNVAITNNVSLPSNNLTPITLDGEVKEGFTINTPTNENFNEDKSPNQTAYVLEV